MNHIVDAHHHLWDLNANCYPWLMARGVRRFFGDPTPIQRNYLAADLRADAKPYVVEASVHVQVGVAEDNEVGETAWLQSIADVEGLPSAIVAACALEQPDAMARIEAHRQYACLRGIRQIIGRSPDEDSVTGSDCVVDDPRWLEHFRAIGELGLSFDLQLTPSQMPRVAELLSRAPGTRVALCHCGSPWDQTNAGLEAWRRGLRLLAELPQVSCKISGLGMFDPDWTPDSIRPIVEGCLDEFGPTRCMFGSNFPVDSLHSTFEQVWGAYNDIAAPLAPWARERLNCGTAREFYRIAAAS